MKSSSITCGCSWLVRFKATEYNKCTNTDSVIITVLCRVHYNTYDPSYVEYFVLVWTRSNNYKKYDDMSFKELTVQIDITPFVSVRLLRVFLSNEIPDRKYIDMHMINNVRIRGRKTELELEDANIEIDHKHVDTSFTTVYKDTSDNYTEGKFIFVI